MKNAQTSSQVVLTKLAQEIRQIFLLDRTLLVSRVKDNEENNDPFQRSISKYQASLLFNLFDSSILLSGKSDQQINIDNFMGGNFPNDAYDYIVADLPLGLRSKNLEQPFDFLIRDNWILIYKLLLILSRKGMGLFLVEPSLNDSTEGKKFILKLAQQGLFLNAIFNCPKNSLMPMTSLQPMLVLFSREECKKLFVAEINDISGISTVIYNFRNQVNTNTLDYGKFMEKEDFRSFNSNKIIEQIESLSSQYKEFHRFSLKDIALEINASTKEFDDKPNAIYLPTIGKSEVLTSIDSLTLKHHNYFQVVLDENRVNNIYLKLYFNTDLGRLTLESLKSGAIISKINKGSIEEIQIPLPSPTLQDDIVHTEQKLVDLENQIVLLKKELSLNPKNVKLIDEKIAGALDLFNILTESDKLLSLIRGGESKTVEFKETLSKDVKENIKAKHIEDTALKNIIAFFNTEGGVLLIGVSDKKVITGIEKDIYESDDKYLLHFKNILKDRIGEQWYPLIDYRIAEVEQRKILVIECKKSEIPVYLDNKDFFVRSNPSTDKLEGPKLVDYISRHFGK